MSKIYIADHLGVHKTTTQVEKWFKAQGHEVHWNMYYDPVEMEWCDVAIFEWFEGMMELALKDGWGKKKPIYARAMDIEIWANNANGADISDLTGLMYTSKAYFEVLKERHDLSKYPNLKLAHMPLSIDMNEWTYAPRSKGYNVAILGHFWGSKGEVLVPQFAREIIDKTGNKDWKFYLQGNWRHDVWEWYFRYTQHIIKELGLENNVFLNEERVSSVDQWLDDKNYLVTFSMKDAFSIPVAEALAKGIKALPHNFQGAKDIWGPYVWSSFSELMTKMIDEDYSSEQNRAYVQERYSNEVMMPKLAQFIGV